MRFTSSFLGRAAAPAAVALGLVACGGEPAEPTASADEPFATLISADPVHEQVTIDGLHFLRPEVGLQLLGGNLATDILFVLENRYHFDDCNFSGAARTIVANQRAAVEFLNPENDTPETTFSAIAAFARSLHAIQDFYSHTNWVESGATGLVDASLGEWPALAPYSVLSPSNLMIVQGEPPAGTTVSRNASGAYPESTVVEVERGAERWRGLMSGSVDYEPGEFCPAAVRMTHEQLNKDRTAMAGRAEQHERAKALATTQTTHEWCRLRALARARWGEAGEQRLDTWLTPGATAPVCASAQ
jgi:hypothetical protein